jgi:nucleoside-diphosphate-sugar epimerase
MDLSESNSTLFARIFKSLILDVPFKLYGDGTHARDFTHVDDIVSGTILAMEHIEKCKRNHYELGTSKSYSIRDILKMVPQLKIDHLPSVSEVSITRANTANAELEFNYTPERNIELWLVNQLNNLDYWKSRLLLYEN